MGSPFLISEFKTGLFSYLEPWVSPRDSFTESSNIYVNRGCVFSREGLELVNHRFYSNRVTSDSNQFSTTLPGSIKGSVEIYSDKFYYYESSDGTFKKASGVENLVISLDSKTKLLNIQFPSASSRVFFISYNAPGSPIRAIIPFTDQESQSYGHILADDRGICVFLNGKRVPDLPVDQLGLLFKGKQKNFTFSIPWDFDLSSLVLTFKVAGNTTTIPYKNGFTPAGDVQSLTYNATLKTVSGTLSKDPVDGDWVRFQLFPTRTLTGSGGLVSWDSSRNFIAMTNGVDRILFFDVSKRTLSRPFLPITEDALWKGENQIRRAHYLKFYKNRLVLFDVEVENAGAQNGRWKQSVRWSTPFLDQTGIFSHWNFVSDRPYGGEYSPDTNSYVVSCGVVRDKLVVWYTRDVYVMEPTGTTQVPFVFNKISNSKIANCPFSATDLDTTTQIFGGRGYLTSDGVSVSRMDLNIPDYYKKIDFTRRDRINSYRFSGDDNRICTLYPSFKSPNSECDRMLVFNFVENTFSEYNWGKPKASCLGEIRAEQVVTWEDMKNYLFRPDTAWFSFDSFASHVSEDIPVVGGMEGQVYALRGHSDWNTQTQAAEGIDWSFKTCQFSPFLNDGQMSYFSYMDIYFEGFGQPTPIVLDIFINGSKKPSKSVDFSLEAPIEEESFRRVHLQVSAYFVAFRFRSDPSVPFRAPLKLLGFAFYARPGGTAKNVKALLGRT